MFRSLSTKNVWGLYIEDTCLNAVKASRKGGKLLVEAFDTVKYSELDSGVKQQIKSEPKIQFKPFPVEQKKTPSDLAAQDVTIKNLANLAGKAITLFLTRNQISSSDKILIALPSQFVLSRFVSLPAVKKNQLKNIVRFEVEKHIPIDASEIIWDFHSLNNKPVPGKGIEVGIFAIKKEDVYTFLSSFQLLKDNLTTIQIGSIALYNFLLFNEHEIHTTMLIEIGAENTNLMIIDSKKIWTRNIPTTDMGNNFIDEIKRSTGYYKSLVKEVEVKYLIVTGALHKQEDKKRFISQSLGYELKDIVLTKNNVEISDLVDNESFNNNISRLIIPLGLTMQGLSLGKINLNLIPEEFATRAALSGKKKAALFSSVIFLTGALILLFGQRIQNNRLLILSNNGLDIFNRAVELESRYKNKEKVYNETKRNLDQFSLIGEGRTFWNKVIPKIIGVIPENAVLLSLITDWMTSPDKALSMSLKGKSFDPRLGFIEDKIKNPLERIVLNDNGKEIPVFEGVNIVPDSIRQDKEGINFEIKWTVKYETFLLLSDIEELNN